ncbi:hypothetical protein CI109_107330 [Kwoniella shandongensis]|uniref:Signal recognition particle subunit SRP68 n=1 Tax=Kwoniella shandongensis TaxID=1734106 RepID=A0A5M6C011_9TREE|nr:uncharacterized protein CI109_004742 [Kwoniella shandongensis]KAA5526965.1 hypothetical protein CI109_004742 [Kwoniella shandongensis]
MASQQTDLSFKLLSLLSKERAVYGLRNGDNERYRRHCANKIHRLRQVTGSTCGKGKVYKAPATVDANSVKDIKQLHLLLFSAERALAHSHEFKAIKSKTPTIKRDQISWLRRALKLSTQLYEIVQSLAATTTSSSTGGGVKVDQRTLAEVTIYHLTIRAENAFERSNWISALSDLAVRRRILTTLSEGAKDSYDEALAIEFIDAQDPLIRFCAYKLGRPESHDIEGVMKDVDEEVMEEALPGLGKLIEGLRGETGVEEMEKGRKRLEDVEFAGEKVELRNAEIVGVMVRVQEVLNKLEEGKKSGAKGKGGKGMKGWDRVLSVLGEAEGVARKLLEDHEASGSSTSLRSTKTAQSLSLAHQYIIYLLLTHRIQRDLALVETLSSSGQSLPSDPTKFKITGGKMRVEEVVKTLGGVVKLYDTVLQSLRQASELSVVQEKEGVRGGVEGLEAYFHATKCYTLARLHCLHPTPSYGSAIQLLSAAALSIRQAKSYLVDPATPLEELIVTLPPSELEKLETDINDLESATKRALFAEKIDKPVFFDMAFNYVDLPIEELEVLGGKREKAVRSTVGAVAEVAGATVNKVVESVKQRGTREATPAATNRDDEDEGRAGGGGAGAGGEGKKGWLGGWFGRGK